MSILIHNCTAVLMDEAGTVLPNAYVVVEGTKIRSVSTQRPWGSFEEQIDGQGNVLMPGFVNAHSHVPMTAMRGYGDGNNLQDWLHNYIFPVEARWDDRAIRACTDLGLAEMIASGVTTIADMYGHTDAVAQEVAASGISANLCCGGVQFTDTFDPATHHDCVVQRELTEKWHGYNDGQILVDASIHGEYTSHHPLWQWMADYAREHGLGMHVHISETRTEHDECLARHGKTPIQVLNDYGVWDVRAIAAHCVWTTPEDWSVMASKGGFGHPQSHEQPQAGQRHRPRPRHGQGRCQRVPGHRRRVLQQLHRLLRGHEAGRHSPQRGQLRPPGPAAHRRPAHGHRQRRQGPGAAHRPD